MSLHQPVYVQPVSGDPSWPSGIPFSAQELRRLQQALVSIAPGLQASQAGITPLDDQLLISQRGAGANFSVDVQPGYGFVFGSDIGSQGLYGVWNDGVVNVSTPTAPASGTEVHRLVLQVEDKLSNGTWTGYTANLNLLADTGSGTPAQPASSITLALISISAGQASVLNANIADQRPILFSPGLLTSTGNPQLVNQTALANVTGLTCAVGAHTYDFCARIFWTQGSTASRQNFGVTTPAASSSRVSYAEWSESTGGESIFGGSNVVNSVLFGEASGQPPTHTVESVIEGWATFTAPGAFAIQASCASASDTFTISQGSFVDIVRRG